LVPRLLLLLLLLSHPHRRAKQLLRLPCIRKKRFAMGGRLISPQSLLRPSVSGIESAVRSIKSYFTSSA
jgi:hypothetical protein